MLTWINDIFRSFLSLFDRVVYWFISILVSLFDQLANVRVFDDTTLGAFSKRIFFLISILMIFKVSFSIIKYIINPDTFTDNEKGMGKVIQSVILVLVSLVCVQYVFDVAYKLQESLLKSQVIEQLILGVATDTTSGVSTEEQKNAKDRVPFYLLSAFIRPNTIDIPEFSYHPEYEIYWCTSPRFTAGVYEISPEGVVTNVYDENFGNCIDEITKEASRTYQKSESTDTFSGLTGTVYNEAQKSYNYSMLLDLINDKHKDFNDKYLFEYQYIVSTAAGIFFAIMYLNFCIDLAIRAVKFGFLQLIAPIPIISMIDPKSSKSGMMSKWVGHCINTYLGLFIRIAVVNFAIFVINLIYTNKITVSGGEVGTFMKVVILFGTIMFAKEAPKLINELTGGKLSGDFKMNPFSRVPGLGVAASGVVGGIAGGIAAGVTHKQLGHSAGLTTAGVFRGIGQGMTSGITGGVKNHGQHFLKNGLAASRAQSDRVRKNDGTTSGGRIKSSVSKAIGISTEEDNSVEYNRSMDHGKKLFEQYGSVTADGMYRNSDFADAVKLSSDSKRKMIEAENNLEELQRRATLGDNSVTQEMINNAREEAANRKTYYETAKTRVETLGKKYTGDYRNYRDFKAYKDLYDAEHAGNVLSGNNNNPSSQGGSRNGFVSHSSTQQQTGGQMQSVTPPSRSGNGNNGNNP